MEYSAERGGLVAVAHAIYNWAAGSETDWFNHALFREVFGSSIGEEQLSSVRTRLEKDAAFLIWRNELVLRWRGRMTAEDKLSEAEARALIGELVESFNHALLYDHTLIANSTYMRRGDTSMRDMHMSGSMPCWTVHLTTQGSALFVGRQTEQTVARGNMMLMRPDAAYHYGLHPREEEWEHLWALFQPRANWAELLKWATPDQEIACLELPGEAAVGRIESLFRELIALGEERGPYRNELRYNKLDEFLIRTRGFAADNDCNTLDSRIQ